MCKPGATKQARTKRAWSVTRRVPAWCYDWIFWGKVKIPRRSVTRFLMRKGIKAVKRRDKYKRLHLFAVYTRNGEDQMCCGFFT